MMNICSKYGIDVLIIYGSYGGHRQDMMYDIFMTDDRQRQEYGISSPQVS